MMVRAEVIADSVSPQGRRLTTFKLRYPWFVHGELMTHRVLSRNASSNRAVPLSKMLEEARSDDLRAEPVYWGAEQKGMEPGEELSDRPLSAGDVGSPRKRVRWEWRQAALEAANRAERMYAYSAHKSLCNRLLMPFTHANVVVTATEWDNFFGLRLDAAADPTMRALAVAMWEALRASAPKLLQPGQWHLPFVSDEDKDTGGIYDEQQAIRVSVARCARVSYESFPTVLPDGIVVPGKRSTVEEDLKLYDRLVGAQPMHASPAEHQATPDTLIKINDPLHYGMIDGWANPAEHGNLVGWRQYRKTLLGESGAAELAR